MIFNKIGIKFVDIDSAAKFFIEKLFFNQHSLLKTKTGKRIICLEKDGVILEIFETHKKINPGGFLKLLSFKVQNIEKTIEELKNKGVKIIEDVTMSSSLDGKKFCYAYFYGPESIKLGLFQEI